MTRWLSKRKTIDHLAMQVAVQLTPANGWHRNPTLKCTALQLLPVSLAKMATPARSAVPPLGHTMRRSPHAKSATSAQSSQAGIPALTELPRRVRPTAGRRASVRTRPRNPCHLPVAYGAKACRRFRLDAIPSRPFGPGPLLRSNGPVVLPFLSLACKDEQHGLNVYAPSAYVPSRRAACRPPPSPAPPCRRQLWVSGREQQHRGQAAS